MYWHRCVLPPEREVHIRTPEIALGALLKWANLVTTGGEAKSVIGQGRVRVNGQVETRRGRQIRPGDRITVRGGGTILVAREADAPTTSAVAPRVS